jgi:hypothetical protein
MYHEETFLELSPEEVSLAFECLVFQALPPAQLKHLSLEEWQAILELLEDLMLEKGEYEKMGLLH